MIGFQTTNRKHLNSKISPAEQKPFIELVDKILELKKSGENTDDLEREIDGMVYKLYDLTHEEIAAIEGGGN